MAGLSYGIMIVASGLLVFTLGADFWFAGVAALVISTGVIAVHGILSGTATADFGGVRNTGIVVGIVDGFVYLGTALQSVVIGFIVPTGAAAKTPDAWSSWPIVLVPFAVIGFVLTLKIWRALPARATSATASQPATNGADSAGSELKRATT
jgi:OPA family glycerol-3-phosphate transporter-like MFS transporter